jgi:heptosyltransferase-3
LSLRKSVAARVRMALRAGGDLPEGPYIVVHATARWERRRWPAERFVRLIGKLREATGRAFVLVSSREDAPLVEPILASFSGIRGVQWVAPASLVETAVLVDGADLYVGNDSGPLHLAAALGVPCVGLFGPASPELTAPRSPSIVPLYRKVACSPCDQTGCPHASALCMEAISVDDVAQTILHALRPPSRSSAHG